MSSTVLPVKQSRLVTKYLDAAGIDQCQSTGSVLWGGLLPMSDLKREKSSVVAIIMKTFLEKSGEMQIHILSP